MNGADVILASLLEGGINVCFANPGTSEMHFVSALDRIPGMRCVLGLAETVVTGAADGYGRIAGRPAVTLLHTGPGLANGLSNLHNARRGPSPIVNLVGDHATYHAKHDAPLACDVLSLARPMSHWVHRIEVAAHAAADTAAAIRVSHEGAGRIATLILPADIAWTNVAVESTAHTTSKDPAPVEPKELQNALEALRGGTSTMILLGGNLSRSRLEKAAAVAATCGVRLARELFPTLLAHGAGTPTIEHMPYPPEAMHAFMATTRHLILVGASPPATFFAYPDVESSAVPDDCRVHILAGHDDRIDSVLDELLRLTMSASAAFRVNQSGSPPQSAGRPFKADVVAEILAAALPENAIVIEEAISSSPPLMGALSGARAHDLLFAAGGSIGWGIPAAIGAAVAAPHRKVICLTGDGSALYSIQGLWTMAREHLNVVVVIYANRDYSVLKTEFNRVGALPMGERAHAVTSIGDPTIEFCALAEGFGVASARADSPAVFASELSLAMSARGPRLIEAILALPEQASEVNIVNGIPK